MKDYYSTLYESTKSAEERKKLGQFFTHRLLIDLIVREIPITNKSSLIDPTCGAGAFLAFIKEELDIETTNIYGMDIDLEAINLCKKNLGEDNGNILKGDFLKIDPLNYFSETLKDGGFDVVLGNPPFKHIKKDIHYDPANKVYKDVIDGIVDFSSLAIAKSLSILKDGGFLGFVLPKTMLRVKSFNKLREYLKENTSIISIIDVGHYFKDVRGDQIILILKKERPMSNHKIKIKRLDSKNRTTSYSIPQSLIDKYDFYPIFRSKEFFRLADKLFKIPLNLERVSNGNIFRGVSFPGKNLKKIDAGPVCHRGSTIKNFGIKHDLYLEKDKLVGLNKKLIERLRNNKIIIQNICSKEGGIRASLSSKSEINNDTVTNIISDNINNYYLLGLLNSDLCNFFLIDIIYLSSNFTMHTDRHYIGKLPIIYPKRDEERLIEISVKEIIKKISKKGNYDEDLGNLNELIYLVYKISDKEINLINKTLKERKG